MIADHGRLATEQWRDGVLTRMLVSAANGAAELCVFEQFCDPGCGAPIHTHTVEEVLIVLAGTAEITVGETRATATAGQSVTIAAGLRHGFVNTGAGMLHVQAILAAPIFEAYDEGGALRRRWTAG